MAPNQEIEKRRFRFLYSLYNATDHGRQNFANMLAIGSEIGLPPQVVGPFAESLKNEGLIIFRGRENIIGITMQGILVVEEAIHDPRSPSRRYLPEETARDYTNLRRMMDLLKKSYTFLSVSEEDLKEFKADLTTMAAQLESPNPKEEVFIICLKSFLAIIRKDAENPLAGKLKAGVGKMLAKLDPAAG